MSKINGNIIQNNLRADVLNKASKVLDNTELVDKAMENILGNREVVITHKLTKLKPKKVKN